MNSVDAGDPRAAQATETEHTGPRIGFLDGLRCLAILVVIPFHWFSRWTPPRSAENLYPYGNVLANIFSFGLCGVELFFIISGFVIALTLFKCESAIEFLSRRFARLFPAMLICSVITFLITTFVPGGEPFRVHLASFLPSLTFIEPGIYNKLTSSKMFNSVDGAYWSLYIEVKFYLLVSLLYFVNRKHFSRNILTYSVVTFVAECACTAYLGHGKAHVAHLLHGATRFLQLEDYLPWFLIGIGFFFHAQRKAPIQWLPPAALGIAELLISSGGKLSPALAAVIVPGVFFAAMSLAPVQRFLSFSLFTNIGLASYSLYLLHQNIGVTLIRFFSQAARLSPESSIAFASVLAVSMIGFSCLLFTFYERRANRFLSRFLLSISSRTIIPPAES